MEGNHPLVAPVAARVQRLLEDARGHDAVPFDDFGVQSFRGGSAGLSPLDIDPEDEILVATLAACGRLVWSEEHWAWILPTSA